MTKIGIALPGQSVEDVQLAAEAAAPYNYDSFSVYGDLGDLPPYAVLHASGDLLAGSRVGSVGPMGVPVGLQHPEVIAMHARALAEQLPHQSHVGLVRGAFLEKIGEKPASLSRLEQTVGAVRENTDAPIYIGGFGPKLLALAGRLDVDGIKLGGSTNVELAKQAKNTIANDEVDIVLGAVSVIDDDRTAARQLARREVAKYLHVVGGYDTTLDGDEQASLEQFLERYPHDASAHDSISDSLLDKFAMAGTPLDVIERVAVIDGTVDRFELGTPHGLGERDVAIRYIGGTVLPEFGA